MVAGTEIMGGDEQAEHKRSLDQWKSIIMDICHIFVQTYRMYNAKSEP